MLYCTSLISLGTAEIQNLLAPPVSDDDAEEGSDGESPGSLNAYVADQAAQDAYIQAMVPNPIPIAEGLSGFEVSAAAAAMDEDLGFPSTSLMTSSTTNGYVDTNVEDIACMSTFSAVRSSAKRVHKQMNASVVSPGGTPSLQFGQPFTKKLKAGAAGSASVTQTPALIRTSLDGVSAPNPLLFGRPINLPTEAKLDRPASAPTPAASKPKLLKVSLKPRPAQMVKAPKGAVKEGSIIPALPVQREVVPLAILNSRKFITPERSLTYSAPPCLAEKLKEKGSRAPLCKLMVKGKIEATVGSTESAVALVPAPPIKITKTTIHATSATASKKRAGTSNKKKKVPTSSSSKSTIKKKTNPAKTKKTVIKEKTTATTQGKDASTVPPTAENKESGASSSAIAEKLMVANPLANVSPTAPAKITTQSNPKPKTASQPVKAPAALAHPAPAVVSSNSSAASISSDDQNMDVTAVTSGTSNTNSSKTPRNRPLTSEEKAQACRNRNRQHARNTRLRKKAYVDELKASLTKMVEERDRAEAVRKEAESKKEQKRLARKQILQDFLKCRGENQRDCSIWGGLVQDSKTFRLTLPITNFQTMVETSDSTKAVDHQVLVGIQDIMADTSYLASFLQSLGSTGNTTKENEDSANATKPVYLEFSCDDSLFLLDGDASLLYWSATTRGLLSKVSQVKLAAATWFYLTPKMSNTYLFCF